MPQSISTGFVFSFTDAGSNNVLNMINCTYLKFIECDMYLGLHYFDQSDES